VEKGVQKHLGERVSIGVVRFFGGKGANLVYYR